jgi:hypothetical protein
MPLVPKAAPEAWDLEADRCGAIDVLAVGIKIFLGVGTAAFGGKPDIEPTSPNVRVRPD